MELKDVLYQMMSESQRASQPADLRIGTVTAVNPLEVTINTSMAPLRAGILLLTAAVVEKKIPILTHSHHTSNLSHSHSTGGLGHTHTISNSQTSENLTGSYKSSTELTDSYESDVQLSNIACYENQTQLPVENGYIILNRALEVGDKVLLLRVQSGQKFIILSRVFEGGS